jgi:hypothetical protein
MVKSLNLTHGNNMKNYVLQFSMHVVDDVEVPDVPLGSVRKEAGNLYTIDGSNVNSPTGTYIPAMFIMFKAFDSNTFVVFGESPDLNKLVKAMEDVSGESIKKESLKQFARTAEGKKWKCRRVKGTDKDKSPEANPNDRIAVDNKVIFLNQDAPDTDPTESTPLVIDGMEITEMKASIPSNMAGYDLPALIEEDI